MLFSAERPHNLPIKASSGLNLICTAIPPLGLVFFTGAVVMGRGYGRTIEVRENSCHGNSPSRNFGNMMEVILAWII